jgi:ribosomal protein S18 acetylase RimI-like enzyme
MSPVSIPSPRTSKFEITRVSPSDIDDFLKVFSIGFGGPATEADGYGDIPPTYLSALKDSFNGHASAGVEHVHLIARSGGRAVGCGSVHIGKHLAGVYNVTTLPEFRKRGIGTVVSIEAFLIAANRGATRIFFQTQPEGSVQKFYEGLGCAVIFEAALFHRG